MTTTLEAGRELNALVAEKVMGWDFRSRGDEGRLWRRHENWHDRNGRAYYSIMPLLSEDIAAAMLVVERVQALHPGWRFCLLGGDVSFGYIDGSPSKGVDPTSRVAFGWRAEFFGEEDPRVDYGDRHGDEWAETPALAICRAALATVSKEGV